MFLTALDFEWFWSVLDCTFLLKDYMANLASMKSAMADLWSWKEGFKSLKTPCLYVTLEFWKSYKQARNLPALIWRNFHLPLSQMLVLGWRFLSRRSSTAFIRNDKWKSEATQYLLSWIVKCRTWGYAYTPEHELQLEKMQRYISYRETL